MNRPLAVRTRRRAGAGRRLIYIPILHTEADLGGLARSVRRVTTERLGRRAWEQNVNAIGRLWRDLRRTVDGWELPWEKVRLYQDGLPRCGQEVKIVKAVAGAGSQNHQLLLSLARRGATLMGTESPALLLQEYTLVQQALARGDSQAAAAVDRRQQAQSRALLVRRDRYIARRVNQSLRAGEIGLLFLGMLHFPQAYLAKDIRVSYPFLRPPRPRRRMT